MDGLLTNSSDTDAAAPTAGVQPMQRPKLKKIKRAKVRLATPIPPVPEKIMPEADTAVTVAEVDMSPTEQQTVAETPISSQENILDTLLSDAAQTNELPEHPDNNETFSESDKGTELVTASEAQEMASTATGSPYVVEGLPPDLDYESDEAYEAAYEGESGYIKKSIFYAVSCACLLVGLFVGKTLFSSQTVENHGLEGVVLNPDVPAGRPRCGLTDKNQACTFYMMNWYKQELNGRDFYKLAAQLTGRETYMIETDNLRYATVKIRPGAIAQLNIPALLK